MTCSNGSPGFSTSRKKRCALLILAALINDIVHGPQALSLMCNRTVHISHRSGLLKSEALFLFREIDLSGQKKLKETEKIFYSVKISIALLSGLIPANIQLLDPSHGKHSRKVSLFLQKPALFASHFLEKKLKTCNSMNRAGSGFGKKKD